MNEVDHDTYIFGRAEPAHTPEKIIRLVSDEKEEGYAIMAVALQGGAGWDWSAYIGICEGKNREEEWDSTWRKGVKLEEHIAKVLFPEFARKYRWRR